MIFIISSKPLFVKNFFSISENFFSFHRPKTMETSQSLLATRIGLEPTTPSVTGWCSNQLSYRAMIAQVRGCSPPERALLYPKNDFLSSRNLQKPQKTFRENRKSRPQAENGQNKTSGTIAPDVCGRGSKSRTHGTRFWRPLLYQLSYTPKSVLHFLNA